MRIGSLASFRRFVVASTFFEAKLGDAINRIGFVQADPIQSPARAQDLILRQRVGDYRVGDLDRWYPTADVEEGSLYAYGYLSRADWQLLRPVDPYALSRLETAVLTYVAEAGSVGPNDLASLFGRERATNDWGGQSRVTKLALDRLHRLGLLRVVGRERGVRRYATAFPVQGEAPLPEERLRRLVMLVARVLAPVPVKTLSEEVARFRRLAAGSPHHRKVISALVDQGALVRRDIAGLPYVWPTGLPEPDGAGRRVRFLAPFDPIVWDRRRFEHIWGWSYRFEAYTPPQKRLRGFYAMPLMYDDAVIGWVNLSVVDKALRIERGLVTAEPTKRAFRTAFDDEVSRMERFLRCDGEGVRKWPALSAVRKLAK